MIMDQKVYWYLEATKDLKIVYQEGLTQYHCLKIYTNADQASNKETCKSTLSYVAILTS